MGCDPALYGDSACYPEELPLHLVNVDAFLIGKFEGTKKQFAQCVAVGVCSPPKQNSSATRPSYYDNPAYAYYPIFYLSWMHAIDYCIWIGGRLPTEAEWEKAARGASVRAYPWGGRQADCTLANFWANGFCVGDTSQVGKYPLELCPYGALAISGNVWEWINDWYQDDYYSISPMNNPSGPDHGTYKVIRGGGWDFSGKSLLTAARSYDEPEYGKYRSGLRCATTP